MAVGRVPLNSDQIRESKCVAPMQFRRCIFSRTCRVCLFIFVVIYIFCTRKIYPSDTRLSKKRKLTTIYVCIFIKIIISFLYIDLSIFISLSIFFFFFYKSFYCIYFSLKNICYIYIHVFIYIFYKREILCIDSDNTIFSLKLSSIFINTEIGYKLSLRIPIRTGDYHDPSAGRIK